MPFDHSGVHIVLSIENASIVAPSVQTVRRVDSVLANLTFIPWRSIYGLSTALSRVIRPEREPLHRHIEDSDGYLNPII